MQGHQPPEPSPRCPSWCTGTHGDLTVHVGECHEHGGMSVRLMQAFGTHEPRVWISTLSFPPAEAVNYAHVFAMLGHAELAATVRRLGELAEADAAFTRPQPGREHSTTGICTLAPDRPHADVGICRACLDQGLFDLPAPQAAEPEHSEVAHELGECDCPDEPVTFPAGTQVLAVQPLVDIGTGQILPKMARLREDQPGGAR